LCPAFKETAVRIRIAPIVTISLIALLGGQTQAATIEFVPSGTTGGPLVVDQNGEILVDVILRSDPGSSLSVRGTTFYLEVIPLSGTPADGLQFRNLATNPGSVPEPYTDDAGDPGVLFPYIFPGVGSSSTSEKESLGQPVAETLLAQFDSVTGLPLPAGGDSRYFGGSDEYLPGGLGVSVDTTGVLIARLRLAAGANASGTYQIQFVNPDLFGNNESSLDSDESGGVGNPFAATAVVTVQGAPTTVVPAPPGLLLGLIGVPFAGLMARRRARKATA
jgi:hypothetical protein